jgi:5'-deoxynucleotidase YfbR-like HD superfamily hydrolase
MSVQTTDPSRIQDLLPGFEPENELEERVTRDQDLLDGLAWGEPRAGHPEGQVAAHVAHLLDRLDTWDEPSDRRERLRFMALVHDAFKADVRERLPKVGRNHHADRARRFAEGYTTDTSVLSALQHHDRPYNLWRKMKRKGSLDERAFTKMLADIPDIQLFVRFVELDGSTEGKNPEPIAWFRDELERRGYELPEPPRL